MLIYIALVRDLCGDDELVPVPLIVRRSVQLDEAQVLPARARLGCGWWVCQAHRGHHNGLRDHYCCTQQAANARALCMTKGLQPPTAYPGCYSGSTIFLLYRSSGRSRQPVGRLALAPCPYVGPSSLLSPLPPPSDQAWLLRSSALSARKPPPPSHWLLTARRSARTPTSPLPQGWAPRLSHHTHTTGVEKTTDRFKVSASAPAA